MCLDHVMVRDMDTKACIEFTASGQWLGLHPPRPSPGVGGSVQGTLSPGGDKQALHNLGPAPAEPLPCAVGAQALRLLPAGQAAFTFTARWVVRMRL